MKKSCTSGLPRIGLLRQGCCQSRVETCRWLCRCMNVPCGRGRYDIESLTETDSDAFLKFQPQASPPSPHAPLAPLRDDVPLIEPCSGRLSAAARADLGLRDRHTFTPKGTCETSASKPWSSRVRFTVPVDHGNYRNQETPGPGSTSPLGCEDLKRDVCTSVSPKLMNKALQYIYTSEAQRPPLSTLEKMANPVSQHFTLKRYNSRPELWQTVGPHWNRNQIRSSYNVKKPFSFTSPCPKSGQIPLYSGVIGSENMDYIDIPEKDFIPLTVLRTVLPPDTPTAQSSSSPPSYGRQAPLSRLVITVPPGNPSK